MNRRRHHSKDEEVRVRASKQRAMHAAADKMIAWESDALSAQQREQFWQHVADFESAPSTSNFQQLTEAGLKLPEPEAMDDKELKAKLLEVIDALALIRVFVSHTDHLSDRELYAHLFHQTLREEVPLLPQGDEGVWHVDLLGGWSEEDIQLFLKYYADDEWRREWGAQFPDLLVPVHEDPPYDRDRHLPKPYEARSH